MIGTAVDSLGTVTKCPTLAEGWLKVMTHVFKYVLIDEFYSCYLALYKE